jgi:hypothetical protein
MGAQTREGELRIAELCEEVAIANKGQSAEDTEPE